MRRARAAIAPWEAVDVPSAALQALQAGKVIAHDREWSVPVVMALALTDSIWARVIADRQRRGFSPEEDAQVIRIDGRLYASVTFAGDRQDLFFPLNRLSAGSAR